MEFAVIVWSTLAAFIASAITAILVWWMKQGRIHWEQHSARDFWATDDGTVSIVLSKSAEPQFTKAEAESDTVEVERRINSHTAMALSRILEFLPQLDVKVARIVDPATDDVKSVQKGNIVVLGGPLANPLARELATKEAVSFPWWWHDPDNPRAICRHPPKKGSSDYYDANVDRNGDFGIVRQDAGVVAKIRNPWARRKWIFLMAGNYGAGCRAPVDPGTH